MTTPSDSALAPEPEVRASAPMTETTFVATAAGSALAVWPIKATR